MQPNLHAGHAENQYQSHLRLDVHLQVKDQPGRQQGKCDVREQRERAVGVHDVDDGVDVDASPAPGNLLPSVRDRLALEQSDKEEGHAGDGRCGQRSVDDPAMDLLGRDSE